MAYSLRRIRAYISNYELKISIFDGFNHWYKLHEMPKMQRRMLLSHASPNALYCLLLLAEHVLDPSQIEKLHPDLVEQTRRLAKTYAETDTLRNTLELLEYYLGKSYDVRNSAAVEMNFRQDTIVSFFQEKETLFFFQEKATRSFFRREA